MPDPKALVFALLVGSARDGWVQPNQESYTGGIGTGISVFADDGTTVLTPNATTPKIGGSPTVNLTNPKAWLLDVRAHPYAEEGMGNRPQVVVGPVKPIKAEPMDNAWSYYDMMMKVEVRILTRTQDGRGLGFKIDGDRLRRALVDNVRSIMEANFRNPDTTGTYSTIRVMDNGQDSDDPQSGSPLYRTAMQIEVRWFEYNA